jgi:hypothetical protein
MEGLRGAPSVVAVRLNAANYANERKIAIHREIMRRHAPAADERHLKSIFHASAFLVA